MILFVSGATGGHIYPAISLAQHLKTKSMFVFPRRYPAEQILSPYEFDTLTFPLNKLQILLLPITIIKLIQVLRKCRPKVLVATGGGICVPFAYIAWAMKIPVISLEQNSIPGRATRLIQWVASHIVTSFEETKEKIQLKSKVQLLGNPVRSRFPDNELLPFEMNKLNGPVLLIIGGSQGAKGINEFIIKNKHQVLNNGWNIIHLTGPVFFQENFIDKNQKTIQSNESSGANYLAIPYCNNMGKLYEVADMALCRSGATTLAELQQIKIPAMLVPYPYAKDNHQFLNAEAFKRKNKAIRIINEKALSIEIVTQAMHELSKGSQSKNKINTCNATELICRLIKTYLQ